MDNQMTLKELEAITKAFLKTQYAIERLRTFRALSQDPFGKTHSNAVFTFEIEEHLLSAFTKLRHRIFNEIELILNDHMELKIQLIEVIDKGGRWDAFEIMKKDIPNAHACDLWITLIAARDTFPLPSQERDDG